MRRSVSPSTGYPSVAIVALILIAMLVGGETALAQGGLYDVTITNLTRDQQFAPILLVTHNENVHLYELGSAASDELEILAETGNTMPMMDLLVGTLGVWDVATSEGLLAPGASVTVQLQGASQFNRLSLASMLIPTNDAFLAVDSAYLPGGFLTPFLGLPPISTVAALMRDILVVTATAYDAGTEPNDETCASIPGPDFEECGGPGGGGAHEGGECFIHVHAGIHGVGDMTPSARDWRNPVARIVVRRVQ